MNLAAEPSASEISSATPTSNDLVWLECPDGSRQPVGTALALGRSAGNDLQLRDDRVSRHHAVVQLQGRQEYYVNDLGSANGTFLNDRRLTQRTRLYHGDTLTVGDTRFQFHQPYGPPRPRPDRSLTAATLGDVQTRSCWLLVADVEGSTDQARRLEPSRIPALMQQWFDSCRQIIEEAGGSLNKYTGDGFLAFWMDRPGVAAQVAGALRELQSRQPRREPAFRLVLHFGEVALGGVGLPGGEELSGAAVNFTFRMEKLAGSLHRPTLVSAPARAMLGNHLPVTDAGVHEVASFPGPFPFYGLE